MKGKLRNRGIIYIMEIQYTITEDKVKMLEEAQRNLWNLLALTDKNHLKVIIKYEIENISSMIYQVISSAKRNQL